MFWILADYSDTSFSFDDLTFLADRFYRSSYFHLNPPFFPFFWLNSHEGIPLRDFLTSGPMAIRMFLWGNRCAATRLHGDHSVFSAFFAHKNRASHKRSVYSIALRFGKSKNYFRVFLGFYRISMSICGALEMF